MCLGRDFNFITCADTSSTDRGCGRNDRARCESERHPERTWRGRSQS